MTDAAHNRRGKTPAKEEKPKTWAERKADLQAAYRNIPRAFQLV